MIDDEVLVSFEMRESVWTTVVVEAQESLFVESEGTDSFTVAYLSREDFNAAVNRFGGMIEYREVL